MKNIHLIPSPNPSRLLYFGTSKELTLQVNLATFRTFERSPQNIYITSDVEIKDCWVLNTHTNQVYFLKGFYGIQPITKKIILTTDTDLISDGVQAIDDEFLEWFVKNTSCEEVEVLFACRGLNGHTPIGEYKIIIPKTKDRIFSETSEETKQKARDYGNVLAKKETLEKPKTFKELFDNTGIEPTTDENGNIQYNFKATMKEESKQETLEEAAEKYVEDFDLSFYDTVEEIPVKELGKKDFIEGAKCQQHNSFSEEEIMNALHSVELKYNRDFTKIYEGVSKYLKELKNK